MIKSQLFALVVENDALAAYPCIVQYSYDEEGFRSIHILPLIEFDFNQAEVIALVHALSLSSIPDVVVKDYAAEPHTSEAFAIALCNVLVAPKFLFMQRVPQKRLQYDTERVYDDFVVTFLYTLREVLQNGGTQRYVFNNVSRMMVHFFGVLAALQGEAQQLMTLIDDIYESVTDSVSGAITVEKIDAVIAEHQEKAINSDAQASKSTKSEETTFEDEDNTFFAGLFQ